MEVIKAEIRAVDSQSEFCYSYDYYYYYCYYYYDYYYHFHHHHYISFFLLYALPFLYISYKVPLVLSVSRPWRHWSGGKDVSLLTELWVICGLFQGDRLIFWSSQMLPLPYVMAPVNKFFQSLLYNTSDEELMTIWYHFCLHDPVIPRSLYLSTVSQKP